MTQTQTQTNNNTKKRGKRTTLTPYKKAQIERDIKIFRAYKKMKRTGDTYMIGERLAEQFGYANKASIYRALHRAEPMLNERAYTNKTYKTAYL